MGNGNRIKPKNISGSLIEESIELSCFTLKFCVDWRLIFTWQMFERNQVIVENEKREKQITENALILVTLQEKKTGT